MLSALIAPDLTGHLPDPRCFLPLGLCPVRSSPRPLSVSFFLFLPCVSSSSPSPHPIERCPPPPPPSSLVASPSPLPDACFDRFPPLSSSRGLACHLVRPSDHGRQRWRRLASPSASIPPSLFPRRVPLPRIAYSCPPNATLHATKTVAVPLTHSPLRVKESLASLPAPTRVGSSPTHALTPVSSQHTQTHTETRAGCLSTPVLSLGSFCLIFN